MIQFFNTLSGKLEEFKPLQEGKVKMYACGPTVYDYAHIGNFRTFVFEDLLRRFLEFKKFKVTHIMNITDVDDKTIAGASRDGKKLENYTAQYIQAFNEDLRTLHILPPTKQPRATSEITAMIELIKKLVEKGTAYVSEGSVYYRVDSFKNYGKLSKKDLERNIRGTRVDLDEYEKEGGSDFALWKEAREGEPSWDSPWGKGRPAWHIECSAMSMKYLGETFDIHAGGEDLIFPHHENEIAQSEAATGKPFVKYWLHSKHLLVNGEKMSKSKGNFYTLRDLLSKGYDPMAIRLTLFSAHYRSQLNFTLEGLSAAREALKRIRDFWMGKKSELMQASKEGSGEISKLLKTAEERIIKNLEDDLKMPEALGAIFALIHDVNKLPREKMFRNEGKKIDHFFKKFDQVFGIFGPLASAGDIPSEVEKLVGEREAARKQRDFKLADELRERVKMLGYIIEDAPQGASVKKLL
ncbi:MAG: cysteine--tRNA ligase [Candidatus Omnitrophica bacterium]|nr:cysteine--tRNA ligase [Candidatus Omnitrophota bacterium]